MNLYMYTPEEAIHLNAHTAEKDILAKWGFVADEIASLLWLRHGIKVEAVIEPSWFASWSFSSCSSKAVS